MATQKRNVRLTSKPNDQVAGTMVITMGKKVETYGLAMPAGYRFAHRFDVAKADGVVYAVSLGRWQATEFDSCTCKGHRQYGHCKHASAIRALQAARKIPVGI